MTELSDRWATRLQLELRGRSNGCTESLGGMEAPGALEVMRIPSVVVPVCVVLRCVFTSVAK